MSATKVESEVATASILKVINSTLPRDPTLTSEPSSTPQNVAPRLLYRGALSLPDSHLLLDGLTFIINIPVNDPQACRTLLGTPLPLALESMRGRPSLSFAGVVNMEDIYCDLSGGVSLHVHPRCILTHQLFAHNLCAAPVSPSKGCTDTGLRIRLGDASTSSSNPSDIVVYGRPHPSSSVMQLCVARVVPAPPPAPLPKPVAKLRPPRPDDPTPRKPPINAGIARIGLGMKRSLSSKVKGKEKEKGDADEGEPTKKQKKDMDLAGLGKNTRVGLKNDAPIFKVPPLPPAKGKSKMPVPVSAAVGDVFDTPVENEAEAISDFEAQNKLFVKKAAVRLVSAIGVGKQHPDFKEFFNHVYRGTLFALRAIVKTSDLEASQTGAELVDRVAQGHVTLYQGGKGVGVYMLQS